MLNFLVSLVKYNLRAQVRCKEGHSFGLHSCFGVRVGQLKCVFLQDRRDNYTTNSQSVPIAKTFSWTHSKAEERAGRWSGSVGEAIWVEFLRVFPVLL